MLVSVVVVDQLRGVVEASQCTIRLVARTLSKAMHRSSIPRNAISLPQLRQLSATLPVEAAPQIARRVREHTVEHHTVGHNLMVDTIVRSIARPVTRLVAGSIQNSAVDRDRSVLRWWHRCVRRVTALCRLSASTEEIARKLV